ncbi:MAG: MAPEG family protein [Pseudomonadales bacterium]
MELEIFIAASALLIVQQFVAAMLKVAQSDVGFSWGLGSRDEQKPSSVLTGRAERAAGNMLATFPIFVGLVCLLVATESSTASSETGAIIYLFARIAFFLIYLFVTVPMVRTVAWGASIFGMAKMALVLLSAA